MRERDLEGSAGLASVAKPGLPPAEVLLSSRRRVIRDALEPMLRSAPGLGLAGSVPELDPLMESLRTLRPRILLLDLGSRLQRSPVLSSAVEEAAPGTKLVFLLPAFKRTHAAILSRTHARCFVHENSSAEGVIRAVERVAADRCSHIRGACWCPSGFRLLVGATRVQEADWNLSPRELQVLTLLTQACTSSEIGRRLFISPRTVENHIARLFEKLGVHDKRSLSCPDAGPDERTVAAPASGCPLRGRCLPRPAALP